MTKPGKRQLSEKMQERNPLGMRQQITPIDVFATESTERTDTSNTPPEREIQTASPITKAGLQPERSERTESTNDKDDRLRASGEVNASTEGPQRTGTQSISPERVSRTTRPTNNDELSSERLERTESTSDKDDRLRSSGEVNASTEQPSERIDTPEEPKRKQERKRRTAKTNEEAELSSPTSKPNRKTDTTKRTVLQELRQGVEETTAHTERYSFEIYPDQKDRIKELQDLYQQKTGRKLSASRILREGLDMYLEKAFHLLREG